MSTGYLDPQPFRAWYAGLKERHPVEQIADQLGVDARSLRRWDEPSSKIRRTDLEAALVDTDYVLWDIYPEFAPKVRIPGPQHQPGHGSKLTDKEVTDLHRFHSAGVPVKTLAERIWRRAGYSSWQSAEWGIRAGFRRLGLPVTKGLRLATDERRCRHEDENGRCEQFAMKDSDRCFGHDPATQQKAREASRRGSELRWAKARAAA